MSTELGWSYCCAKAPPSFSAQYDFFDDVPPEWLDPPANNNGAPSKAGQIKAAPFEWVNASTLPMRAWLYAHHFIRGFLSATIAPGGIGKSALLIVEALAMVTGKNLLGVKPSAPLRVWYVNLEDPLEELKRRFAAACLHHNISALDIGDRLFVNSGRDTEFVIAHEDRGTLKIATPTIEAIREEIRNKQIDILIIDPFVASHGVSENDNSKINAVCRQWAMIAEETGCAIELVHHVRKAAFGQGEYSVDDARGASALLAAVRSARALNAMSKDEAARAGVSEPRLHFRIDNGKANLAPPADKTTWRRLGSVQLGNGEAIPHAGDSVGVVTAWEWPDPSEDVTPDEIRAVQETIAAGEWRESAQAKAWAGRAIADALGLDISEPTAKAKVKALLRTWLEMGILKAVQGKDAQRVTRAFIQVGKRVS
jgi:hypothetical protein